MPSYDEYQAAEPDQQFLQDVVAPPPAAPAPATAPVAPPAAAAPAVAYDPGFNVGERNFSTLAGGDTMFGYQDFIGPDELQRMVAARPDLFAGIEDPMSQLTANMVEGESQQQQQGWNASPELQKVFEGMSLQRRGVEGLEDGRTNALYDPEGNLVYADTPYVYNPAGETLGTLLEAASMASAAFGLVGAPLFGGITSGLNAAFAPTLGATGANMATQALVQGTLGGASSSARGGSFGEGFGRGALTGAITGGVSPYISQFGDTISSTIGGDLGSAASGAFTGAARSGIGALTSGTSVGEALLSGGIGGGVNAGMASLGGSEYLSTLPPSLRNAVTSAIGAGILGRDPSQAAINAFIGSLSLPSRSPEEQALYDAYQSPQGQSSRDQDIYNPYGGAGGADGFTSQWQSVGSDRVFIHDDGSATVLNPGTGETFDMNQEEVQQMAASGLLNTPQSGYDAAISGTPATSGARPPASGTAPRAPSAAAPGASGASGASAATSQRSGSRGNGPSLEELIALLGGDEGTNAAQIATRSPYGNEIYGMRFGNG